jgi:hypothetical protein
MSQVTEGTDEMKISSGMSQSGMGDKIFVIVQYCLQVCLGFQGAGKGLGRSTIVSQ